MLWLPSCIDPLRHHPTAERIWVGVEKPVTADNLPSRGRAARNETKVRLYLLLALSLVSSCKRLSERDRDEALLTHFGLRAAGSHDSSMSALQREVLRHTPLGSRTVVVTAYLDSIGFPDAPSGAARRRNFAEPGAVVIEARLEHRAHRWYDLDPCNYTHEVQFAMDAGDRLRNVRSVESGSCL